MASGMSIQIEKRIADELGVQVRQVAAAVALLDESATVPFIARYRKEATGGLDDTQLRQLADRLVYLRELEGRRVAILSSIEEQGKLTPELKAEIVSAETKQVLEDLYLPYKPKRRTKAQIAREAGLEPLAVSLLENPMQVPEASAATYVDAEKGVADVKAALDGARQILMERFSEDAALLGRLREHLQREGVVKSTLLEGKENEGQKFRDYFDYAEAIRDVPSHRALALFRGRNESVLRLELKLPEELAATEGRPVANACEGMVASQFGIRDNGRPADRWLLDTVRWAWRVKLSLHLELELFNGLFAQAEDEAIRVFAANLKDLLLAAPAGPKAVLGLDPGIRTGVKVAVVDRTGKLLDTTTVYPHEPRNDWEGALHALAVMVNRHGVELISIGNGTASRETDRLAADLMKRYPEARLSKVVVSEAGASVYSASEFAAREFPELDVSLRGAVSIARRVQDPLAELVKIEPKAIGVGQYQHDVSQTKLAHSLDGVVEDCVNAVGVDLNTASAALLARVSGLNASLAAGIVAYRDQNGPFPDRRTLLKVPRLGAKTFEQAAGFLRIANGENPLDASAVHPEAYPLVERILGAAGTHVRGLIGNHDILRRLDPGKFTDERFGLPTVKDIFRELEKPGRDPRPEFKMAAFKEGVEDLKDLQPGMLLEGVVTNVTNFGAFVDIGVHQDGLVHVSMLTNRFVKDPREVVKAGDIVRVKVMEVDIPRRRIGLSMRLDADLPSGSPSTGRGAPLSGRERAQARQPDRGGNALSDALSRAMGRH